MSIRSTRDRSGVLYLVIVLVYFCATNLCHAQRAATRQFDAADLEKAPVLFAENCKTCHGKAGKGDGPAATRISPRPRNLRDGYFYIISSSNMIPFRADLIRTIEKGLDGTMMPPFAKELNDKEIALLADYILKISTEDRINEFTRMPAVAKLSPPIIEKLVQNRFIAKGKVNAPGEPVEDAASLARGKALYAKNCELCHGNQGEGRADPNWRNSAGESVRTLPFNSMTFKGGSGSLDIYTRIYSGIPGTPQPGFGSLPASEIWDIVHYVQSLMALPVESKKSE